MLDQWHKMQLEEEITEGSTQKKLNDKIMKYASKTTRITETKGKLGQITSSVKSVSKKGT